MNKDSNHNPAAERADSLPSIFTVIFTSIEAHKHRTREDLCGIGKVETVLPDIRAILTFIPFELQTGVSGSV